MEQIEAFLEVFAAGGLLCGIAWFLARKRIRQSWHWRVPFCLLVAASITPTAIKFWGSWSFIPAAFFAPVIFGFDRDSLTTGFLLGWLPICLVASVIFGFWQIILRRHNHVA